MSRVADAPSKSVLCLGVYLSDKAHYAAEITDNFLSATDWNVDCRWALLGEAPPPTSLAACTVIRQRQRMEKSMVINQLLKTVDIDDYEYVIVTDDDIGMPDSFLDRFLSVVERRSFSLSQPARTHTSFIDHYFVAQLMGIESRCTNFVEIGPLFCAHRSSFHVLFPLDEHAPMGWGLDFVWPVRMEQAQLTMGIVDSTPIEHALRKPVSYYNYSETDARMKAYFDSRPHLSYEQSFRIYHSFLDNQ